MKVLYVLGVERDEDVGLLPGRPQRSWASTKYSKNMSLKKAIEGGGLRLSQPKLYNRQVVIKLSFRVVLLKYLSSISLEWNNSV